MSPLADYNYAIRPPPSTDTTSDEDVSRSFLPKEPTQAAKSAMAFFYSTEHRIVIAVKSAAQPRDSVLTKKLGISCTCSNIGQTTAVASSSKLIS